MSAVAPILGNGGPLIVEHSDSGLAGVHHRLDRQHHSFAQPRTVSAGAVIRNLWLLMELGADAVSYKVANDAEAIGFYHLLHSRPDIANGAADADRLDSTLQRSLRDLEQLLYFRAHRVPHRDGNCRIAVIAV